MRSRWEFGDGTNASPSTLTPTHVYNHYGTYTVTLKVTDDDGGLDSDTLTLTLVSARSYVEQTVAKLTPFQEESNKIKDALKKLRKVLGRVWPDEVHVGSKDGALVFSSLKQVVDDLKRLLKDNRAGLSAEAEAAVECAIDYLVKAARLLAETLLVEVEGMTALDPVRQENVDREAAKAREDFTKGDAQRLAGNLSKAIDHYRKAWEHATRAGVEATRN